jgi:gas vesicle protein
MSEHYDDGRGVAMLIAGFGLGTLVGTIIGMLVAPKAGRELRADIVDYSRDTYDKVKDTSRDAYERGRERARTAYEAGREKATEYSSRVGQKIGEVREQIAGTAQRIGGAIKHGAEAVAEGESGEHTAPA